MQPNEQIVLFIESLPETIRETVSCQVLINFDFRHFLTREPAFSARLKSLALPDETNDREGRAVLIAAALDYTFARPQIDGVERIAGHPDASLVSRTLAAQWPLMSRHYEQAATEWRELRRGPLNLDEIRKAHTRETMEAIGGPTTDERT